MQSYDLLPMRAPRLTGRALETFTRLVESPLTRWALGPKLLRDAGIERFRLTVVDEPPSVRPDLPGRASPGLSAAPERSPAELVEEAATAPLGGDERATGFAFETAADFARAYREGRTTPLEVAERLLEALARFDAQDPPLRALIAWREQDLLAQAREANERLRRGELRGPLDGVPVAIKDELDQTPFRTTVGTRFLGGAPAEEDAEVVARLRAAGALLIGKANMHEIGIGVTGLNPHHGTARNPYHLGHHTGGSSSGSAAAVAAGLCPLAIGADGGGSIRTPASFCGLVGLKATFGRISERGAFPLCWSVAHVGPLAATVRDAALGYAAIAGADPRDPNSASQPAPGLARLADPDLRGVRIGVFRPWYEDASPDVVRACDQGLAALEARGAVVRPVELPGLELARVAHMITITSEMNASMEDHYARHREDHGLDVRVSLALTRLLTGRDYVRAQRVRTRFTALCMRLMREVDLIATPTNGRTAPAIGPHDLPRGVSDIVTTGAVLRFVFPANLTGFPAISVPAGYDVAGLPIGLQLMGRPWEEDLLLRAAAEVERTVPRRAPALSVRLLPPG